jgi:NADPH-dependent 2,4-dienoyl-CoA reductase/sulfur reductase-like enzyme
VVETLTVDVAIVGAGPAGLAAACRAAEAGARVLVADEGPAPGGTIWRRRGSMPRTARGWLERFSRSGASLRTGALVFDAPQAGVLCLEVHGAPVLVLSGTTILATGARERFLPFPGWTLPQVVGVGGAQALAKSGASFRGQRVVIAGTGPLLLPTAAALAHAGARIQAVVEQAPNRLVSRFAASLWRQPGKLAAAAIYRSSFLGTRYRCGTWVRSATGEGAVREVQLTDGLRSWSEPCDVLACGYGLVPNSELARRLRCGVSGDRVVVNDLQETTQATVYCAGEPTGVGGSDLALLEGEIAGLAAVGRRREALALGPRRAVLQDFARRLEQTFALRDELRHLATPSTLVCRCEDVPLSDIEAEWQPRQAKLWTRAGMGACQGRVCGPALQYLFGWDSDTVRPPLKPVRVGTLAALLNAAAAAQGTFPRREP